MIGLRLEEQQQQQHFQQHRYRRLPTFNENLTSTPYFPLFTTERRPQRDEQQLDDNQQYCTAFQPIVRIVLLSELLVE